MTVHARRPTLVCFAAYLAAYRLYARFLADRLFDSALLETMESIDRVLGLD